MARPKSAKGRSSLELSRLPEKVRQARADAIGEVRGKTRARIPTEVGSAFNGAVNLAINQPAPKKKGK